MNSGTMLNAYPDSMGGRLGEAVKLLARPEMKDVFRSFYILPSMFNTDLDRGFSIISYDVSRELADEKDLAALRALGIDLKLDFVLNHLSVLSPQFQDIVKNGEKSKYTDFFINWNAFWKDHGEMTEGGYIMPEDSSMEKMFFRKPGLPLLMVRMPDGRDVPYWNTFYQEITYPRIDAQDLMDAMEIQFLTAERLAERINAALSGGKTPKEIDFSGFEEYREAACDYLESRRRYLGQMDVNLRSPLVWDFYAQTLRRLAEYGAAIVRLDAFAYAPKEPGTRCFLNEPDTWDVLARISGMAQPHGLELLPEIHASYAEGRYAQMADLGYMIYDFFLPGLLIDAIEHRDAEYLIRWANELREKKIRAVNMLGCHDGIPLLDLKGLLPDERIEEMISLIVSRGGLIKDLHGKKNMYYQVNATYYSALGEDDRKMLAARALQLFMPGKPQIWYLDLFAGKNDYEAVKRSGAAGHKEINRTNLTEAQIEEALGRPVVRDQLALLRMRNACAAFGFDADFVIEQKAGNRLCMAWEKGGARASLEIGFETLAFVIEADMPDGVFRYEQE